MDSTITTLPLVVLAIAGFAGLGRLAGARSAMLCVTLGLGLAGAAVAPLAVFAAGLIRGALLALLLLGFAALLWPLQRDPLGRLRRLFGAETCARAPVFLACLLISGALLAFLEAHVYAYEAHDVLYFSPTLEMLIADYLSPIRLFTYYPHEMAAYHFLPSAVIAAALVLVPAPDLAVAIQARFLLSVFVLAALLYRIAGQGTGRRAVLPLALTVAALFVYGEEIAYNLMISSFYYLYLLFCIATFLFEPEREDATARAITWTLLIAAKAPIFFVAAAAAGYFAWRQWAQLRVGVLTAIAALVLANVVSWRVLPSPLGNLAPGLFNPLSGSEVARNAIQFREWMLDEPIVRLLRALAADPGDGALMLLSALALALYLLVKIYAIPLALLLRGERAAGGAAKGGLASFQALSVDERTVCIYFAMSMSAWLALRFGGSIAHTMHAPLLAAALSSLILGQQLARRHRWWLTACVFLLAAMFAGPSFRHCPTCLPHWHMWSQRSDEATYSVHLRDIGRAAAGRPGASYRPEADEPMLEAELRAALLGARLHAKDAPGPPAGQIARWYPRPEAHGGEND